MIIDGVSAVRGSNTINIPDNGNIYIGGTGSTADSELVGYLDEIRFSKMARYTGQGLIDSDFPNPSTEFGIQTEGSTYGRWDTQVTANTTYQRYNYQHTPIKGYKLNGTSQYLTRGTTDILSGTSIPSNSSPCRRTRAVNSQRARRVSLMTPSDFRTGHD